MNNKPWLCMATVKELEQFAKKVGIPSYRAGQIENWLSKRLTSNLENMKNIRWYWFIGNCLERVGLCSMIIVNW